MSSRRNTSKRCFLNVEVSRTEKEGVRQMAQARSTELGLRVTLSDMTREIIRKAVESHRAGKQELAPVG